MAQEHVIGCHGYNHENYGGRQVKVWTDTKPIYLETNEEKKQQLQKALEVLTATVGRRPEAFVAPFDWIDMDLVRILDELGFKVDSSYHNYTLGLPTAVYPLIGLDMVEIPLSVVNCGEFGMKNVLEAVTFDPNNIDKVLEHDTLLITCHPWEFTDIKIPHPRQVLIVGDEKINALDMLLSTLKSNGYTFTDPLKHIEGAANA